MKITFWGATEDVTGSMTFVHLPEGLIAIDCGMAQGSRDTQKLNELKPIFPTTDIKAVILTHAHLDHSGLLPRLVKEGFRGPIYCTLPTSRLAQVILRDSASLNKDDFYDDEDVTRTLHLMKTVDWHQSVSLLGGSFKLLPAGHILGAASVKINSEDKSVVFSGDLGRTNDPLIPAPEPCPNVDAVIMESTYGNRVRTGNAEKELFSFLMELSRGARVGIIASFAVARAQLLITLIHEFFERHPEEKIRVVMDSPMMVEANKVYKNYSRLTKSPEELRDSIEDFEVIAFDRQWRSLSKKEGPLLIISSSGMLTGGRIKRHLRNWQDDERAILFLPGYQAKGTPGRHFLDGFRDIPAEEPGEENILWKGQVLGSDAFSSHADQNELFDWVKDVSPEAKIFLVHGETESKKGFQQLLVSRGFTGCGIPVRNETIEV